MKEEIVRIQRDALARIAQVSDRRGVEDARVAILGKKGELTMAQTGMKDVPREEKPAVGQLLNEARKAITEALDAKLEEVQALADKAAGARRCPDASGPLPAAGRPASPHDRAG